MINKAGLAAAFTPLHFCNLFLHNSDHFSKEELVENPLFALGIAFVLTVINIALSGFFIYTPRKIKDDFIKEYPQFVKN